MSKRQMSDFQCLQNNCLRILQDIHDTESGASYKWRNVQPSVVESTIALHKLVQAVADRVDRLEGKLDQVLIAVTTLAQDRELKEERYASDNRAFTRSWGALQLSVDQLKAEFEHSIRSHAEALRVIREVSIPELEHEMDSVKEIHKAQSRKEVRLERAEGDIDQLRNHKVDQIDFDAQIRALKIQLEQIQLFPTFNSSSALLSGNSGTAAVSCSRWLWHGGSFSHALAKVISWDERILRIGTCVRWSKSHPSVLKIDREGIYKVTVAVFYDGSCETSIPSLTLYVNNDAIVSAASTTSSCVLRSAASGHHNQMDAGDFKGKKSSVCRRCEAIRCCCEPQALSGLTLSDILLIPLGTVLTVAYRADPRNVRQAVLELECMT
jgi:hypothetical protein